MNRLVLPLLALITQALACSASDGTHEERPQTTASSVASGSATPSNTAQPSKPPPTADNNLPSRESFFGNPDKVAARISPDGKYLAFLAPEEGLLNVWVGPSNDPSKAKPVTKDRKRGIRRYFWTYDGAHLLYLQDEGGNENFHLYAVNVEKGETRDLTPNANVRAEFLAASPRIPGKVIVGLNDRDPKHHDVHEIEIATGKSKLLLENKEGHSFDFDLDLKVRFASKVLDSGGIEYFSVDKKGALKSLFKVGLEDAMSTSSGVFDKSGKKIDFFDSRGRDKAALVVIDPTTGKVEKTLFEPAKADISDVLRHPTERTLQAVASNYGRKEWTFFDKDLEADMALLAKTEKGDVEIGSRTLDDKKWVVAYLRDDGPVRYYLFDRKTKQNTFLFSAKESLEKQKGVSMHPVFVKARDGLELPSYLSLPQTADPDGDGKPAQKSPLVLLVHGGPWARDSWGYNAMHQWLASRGYAVLSVNYRGSTGFGKKFISAADKEWAGKMHDDLIDAVEWTVSQNIADPDRIAVMGGSYGGYAALVALTFTPKKFACAVDIVGPSSLQTLLENIPPYWAPFYPMLTTRLADPKTEQGKTWLASRSPLSFVDKIERPLLIGQGANDPRVKQLESDQIVKAMSAKGIPVTYVLYPDEGHGFARPPNFKSFNAVAEVFLAQCLGGPYQPIGQDFDGASITVPAGVEHVYGVADALGTKK